MKLIDKDAVFAEIDRQKIGYNVDGKHSVEYDTTRKILNIIDTLEVKEVVAEQEGICNSIFNRVMGKNWNLLLPLNKTGLKHGDKVKIFITKEK